MALPTTITGLSTANGHVTQPFISSTGNVYVFGRHNSTSHLLRAFKATDPTSSFSNVGTDVTIVSGTITNYVAAVQQGDLIYCATYSTEGAAPQTSYVRLSIFNMATDAWTVSSETVTNVTDDSSGRGQEIAIGIRSDGDVIVLYAGDSDAVMGTERGRVDYARREGGSWTTGIAVDNAGATSWRALGVVIGSSDRMHFFLMEPTPNAYQRTLTSANSLQSFPSAFTSGISTAVFRSYQLGASYDASGTQKVRYPIGMSDGSISSVKLNSADSPTESLDSNITSSVAPNSASFFRFSLAADDTTLWHTFHDSTNNDIYTQSNPNEAGWDTPALFYNDASAVVGLRTNIYTRGSSIVLAITFTAGSAVKYHEQVLSTGGVSGDGALNLAAVTTTAAGTVSVGGDGALSIGPVTTTTNGTSSITGDGSLSLGDVTTTTSGGPIVQGDGTHTLDAVTTTASGSVTETPVTGDANLNLHSVMLTTQGNVAVTGDASLSLDAVTTTAAGTVSVAGDASLSLDAVTTTADGSVSITGDASHTLDDVTLSATGGALAGIEGDASLTLADVTTTASGSVSITGDATLTLSDTSVTSSGEVAIQGNASLNLHSVIPTADGSVSITGDASIALDPVTTLGEGSAIEGLVANASLTLDAVTTTASGTVVDPVAVEQRGGDDAPPRRVKKVPASDKPNPEKLLDQRLGETLEDLVNPKPAVEATSADPSEPSPEAISDLASALLPRYTLPKQRVYRPERKRLPPPLTDDELILLLLMVI